MSAGGMKKLAHPALVLVLASSCLVLILRASAEEIAENGPINEVFVTMEDGRTFAVDFEPSEKLFELRQRIQDLEGIIWHRQKLSLGGKELIEDRLSLSEHNIKPGASLTLTLVPRNLESYVYVKTLTGENVHVDIDLGQPVKKLRETANWRLTYGREPYTNLRLILNGRSLKDDQKVLAYPIESNTKLLQGKKLEDCRADAEIFVRTLSGATIKCQVDLADTVARLEQLIEAQTGVPREAQVLGYGKNRLRSEDHLCDHGLESGSGVNLAFYSRRVRVPGDIDRLRLPSVKSPYEVPIFREVNDGQADAGRRTDILADTQNWLFQSKKFADIVDLFNPVAKLYLSDQEKRLFNEQARNSKTASVDDDILIYQLPLTRKRMDSVVSRYQRSWKSHISFKRYEGHGIQLGATWLPGENLLANINNYAHDAFSDNEIVDMFDKSETIRRQLDGCSGTGQGIFSFAEQKELNRELILAYARAASIVPPLLRISSEEYVDVGDYLIRRGHVYDGRGIRLGASWRPGKHLAFDINNYAPDDFSGKEIMVLFDRYETVRQLLEKDARTGEVTLSSFKQKELNQELLKIYSEALEGEPSMVEIGDDDERVNGVDCPICYDTLAAEQAVKLPCDHAFHLECISEWLQQYRTSDRVGFCPSCNRDFKIRAQLSKLSIE